MTNPRLGWWVQLVECSAFDDDIRMAVLKGWGSELFNSSICEIDWPESHPMPNQLMMYGTAEDRQPDFNEMAAYVRQRMSATQYFAFVFMKDTLLANGGLECIVITKNTVVRINGQLMITTAIESALNTETFWRTETQTPKCF